MLRASQQLRAPLLINTFPSSSSKLECALAPVVTEKVGTASRIAKPKHSKDAKEVPEQQTEK